MRVDQAKTRTESILDNMTTDEISYTLGRYCGPSNTFLSIKKFGFVLPKDVVEKYLIDRQFEDNFLLENK